MIQEPYVKVTTIDLSNLSSPIPDSLNLGMVIDSDDGPVKITRVDSQTEFIKNYLSGNQLNPTDSDTVKHAFKLLQFMPIYVTRAMDNSILGGITNNGDTIYTDTDFQVMKYYKKLSFKEDDVSFSSVCMKMKINNASDSTATLFYAGTAPKYVYSLDLVLNTTTAIAVLPAADDYIYDISTKKYYKITSISNGVAIVEEYSTTPESEYFRYNFNVNTKRMTFNMPTVSELYAVGSVIKGAITGGSTNLYTITSITSDDGSYVLALNEVIQVPANPVNILNLLLEYNNNPGDYNKFLSIDDSDGKITTTLPNTNSLIYLGYKVKEDDEYTSISMESILESGNYEVIASTGNILSDGNYLSIEGYTYFNDNSVSGNNMYPYINVNFKESSMSVAKLFAYIYDYQVSHNANIVPTSLTNDISLTVQADEVVISDEIKSKYILTQSDAGYGSNSYTIKLVSNSKVEKGFIKITVGSNSYIYYTGLDSTPEGTIANNSIIYTDDGDFYIHSTAKFLYAIMNDSSKYDNNISISESATSKLLYYSQALNSVKVNSAYIEDPVPASSTYKYIFDDDNSILSGRTYKDLQLIIDDYLFYNVSYSTNNPDLTPVKLSSAPLTYIQFIRHLRRIVGNYFNCIDSENGLTLMTNDPEEFSTITYRGTGISMDEVVSENHAAITSSAKFAIINKCPSKKNNLMFSLTRDADDPELWTLVITRKTDETSYTISFIEDKVDGYGRSVYYTYVNEINPYIQLVELDGEESAVLDTYTSKLFGAEVPIASPESDDFVNAINRFRENEGIYYDFLFDGGYANMVYAKGIFEVCKEIYAEGLLTMPQITDPDQLIKYREDCGIDTEQGWRCIMRGNWINDTTVADFLIRMSPMCAYVEKIVNNKTGMKEFAPIFGATNASITYEPGFYIKKKSTREELLTHQIPVIIDDKSLGLRYWNLDTTLKVVDSSLCDANNCRMINIGAHICDNQMKWYIGQFNTESTRANVTEALTNLLSDRLIKNQQYALAGLRVICNDSNNPVSVIENRQLVVDVAYQFYPGIRYINVFQKVYKLSQNLDEL